MNCCAPTGPGPRCPSLQPATWHRYHPMPSWSGQTPTSSPCMDCWTRPRTCLETTTIRMGSKCSTPPTIMAKTCFSRMPPSGRCLSGRKPPTATGWGWTTWRRWKGCCLSSARAQVGQARPAASPGAVQTALPQNLEGAGRGCCGSGEAGGGRFTAVRVGCPGRILARRLRARRAGARRVTQTKLGHECKRSKRGAGRI